MSSHRDPVDVLEQRLRRRIVRTIKEFGLIQEGDRVLVAVSGGKDSYGLLDLLTRIRARSPFPFELVAVHLDQVQPGYDGAPLAAWLADFTARTGVPSEIVQRDTYSIVKRLTKEGGTYCAPCSRLRRGILYDTAERLGCNKLALGHHRDDALETLLLNLFYSGKLQAMPAGYTTNDGRFEVIRPSSRWPRPIWPPTPPCAAFPSCLATSAAARRASSARSWRGCSSAWRARSPMCAR
ncbi:MAG: ATP-binding protein [bacterium]